MSQKNANSNGIWLFNVILRAKRQKIFAYPSSAHALGCTSGLRVITLMIQRGLKKNRDVPRPT